MKKSYQADDEKLVVLFMDLDGFKKVNDTFGHEAGDLLLQEVGVRCQNCMGPDDLLARLAGDEFTILLPQADIEQAMAVSRKMIAEIQKPFPIDKNLVSVTSSIGISLYPEHGETPEMLIKRADEAMYWAKESGKNSFRVYKNVGLVK